MSASRILKNVQEGKASRLIQFMTAVSPTPINSATASNPPRSATTLRTEGETDSMASFRSQKMSESSGPKSRADCALGPAHNKAMARTSKKRPEETAAICQRLRALRATTKLSQADFAKEYKLGKSQWTQAESGYRLGLDGAITLVREFGVTLDWVYLGDRSRMPRDLLAEIDAHMVDDDPMREAS